MNKIDIKSIMEKNINNLKEKMTFHSIFSNWNFLY